MVSYTMPFYFPLLACFWVLVSLFHGEGSFAGPKTAKRTTESSADLIEKARNLILQKDRAQASNILVLAMKREPSHSTAFREMKAALEEISNVFLNDRAQQLYELALSLRQTDQKQAQARLQEALRIEPDNLQILSESARLQIIANNCDNATETTAQARKLNPFDEQTLLTSAQAAVCVRDWPAYTALRSQADGRKGALKTSWLALEIERADLENSESRAQEAFQALKAADAAHPELPYWEWRFGKTPELRKAAGVKYSMFCRNLTTSTMRKHLPEVFLCRRAPEIESAGGPS